MGIISAIIALLKAVPSLERLFLKIADGVKEAQAKASYDEKLTHIDNAMRTARGGLLHTEENEWSEGVDRSPTISEGSTIRANLDERGIKESRGT
tara:strand:- start:141 stop:425 length:285 start_codon:yes stop_codon:yes gene_type:complete